MEYITEECYRKSNERIFHESIFFIYEKMWSLLFHYISLLRKVAYEWIQIYIILTLFFQLPIKYGLICIQTLVFVAQQSAYISNSFFLTEAYHFFIQVCISQPVDIWIPSIFFFPITNYAAKISLHMSLPALICFLVASQLTM